MGTCGKSHISQQLMGKLQTQAEDWIWLWIRLPSHRRPTPAGWGSGHTERSMTAAASDPAVWPVLSQSKACLHLGCSVSYCDFRRSWRPRVGPDWTPVRFTAPGTFHNSIRSSCRLRVERRSQSGWGPQLCGDPSNAQKKLQSQPVKMPQLT